MICALIILLLLMTAFTLHYRRAYYHAADDLRLARAGIARNYQTFRADMLQAVIATPEQIISSHQTYDHDDAIDQRRACMLYRGSERTPAMQAVRQLKYRRLTIHQAKAKAAWLAGFLAYQYHDAKWRVDVITYAPTDPARARQRGFDQAELLAQAVAAKLGVRCRALLRRARAAESQVKVQSGSRRRENLRGAFQALGHLKPGTVVLIVDDVATTGATLNECAAALKAAGAGAVYALTLAGAAQWRRRR
jgi:ComF family protein